MESVRIQWDEELPDGHLVVRGSKMAPAALWANYQQVSLETTDADNPTGLAAICVGVGDGTVSNVCAAMPYKGAWVRCSTVGVLRAAGYRVHRLDDEGYPAHAMLLLKEHPTGADWNGWEHLGELFGDPLPNPSKQEYG